MVLSSVDLVAVIERAQEAEARAAIAEKRYEKLLAETDTIKDIYTVNYIYRNQYNNVAYCDPNLDIRACLLFPYRYKINLVIYAEMAEDTRSVRICYWKGGYRIYKCGNKVTPVLLLTVS